MTIETPGYMNKRKKEKKKIQTKEKKKEEKESMNQHSLPQAFI